MLQQHEFEEAVVAGVEVNCGDACVGEQRTRRRVLIYIEVVDGSDRVGAWL